MFSVEILGFRLSLENAAETIEQISMDIQQNHSLIVELSKPQVVFSIACLSLTILAVVSVWNSQSSSNGSSAKDKRTLKTPQRDASREQHVEREQSLSVEPARPSTDDGLSEQSHVSKISKLTAACADLSGSLHGASINNHALRQQMPKLLEEISNLIGLLCQIQTILSSDPTCFFAKTGLQAVFDNTSTGLLATCAETKVKCTEVADKEYFETLLSQLRNTRSTLEFLKMNLEPQSPSTRERPTVRFERADSSFVPGHKRSLTVPVPQHSTELITPGADVKKWLEEPPEPESYIDSEQLPEYSALPVAPASPSKSNTAAKRTVVSMADIHAVLASEVPEQALQKLLRTGIDPKSTYGRLSRTALHEAARLNKSDCIDVLVQAGALIDAEDSKGDTALHLASWEGHVEACTSLLDAGAEIDRLSGRDGCSPLFCAIGGRHIDLVRLFLRQGARVSLKSPSEMYPLHQAAVTGQTAACEALLSAGAHVDVRDKEGNTPLHNAAAIGNAETVKVLLRNAADVDAKSDRGMTALHWASHKGHDGAVRALLDAGADEDEREDGGATALCCASNRGHVSCVKALLKRGANRKLVCEVWDGGSGTAAQLAKRNGHKEVVALLKTYGL